MKRNTLLLLFLLPFYLHAQILENFSDGDFTQNPTWSGTADRFIINSERLQLNYDANLISGNQAFLSTPSEAVLNGSWEIKIQMQAATSSVNYVKFYLISDSADLSHPSLNGYYVMIGNTQDEISLYKQQNGEQTKLIDGTDKRIDLTNFTITVKITRDEEGTWELFSKLDSETDFISEGTCSDRNIKKASFSGIFVNYSTGNIGKYFFDDIIISRDIFIDTQAPEITGVKLLAANKIKIDFSEEMQSNLNNLRISGYEILSATLSNESTSMEVVFSKNLLRGILHHFQLENIFDLSGNSLMNNSIEYYFPQRKDIIFNEILADPDPQVGLPNGKYIELYNRSNHDISLNEWSISISKTLYPFTNLILPAQKYILLCAKKNEMEFQKFGTVYPFSSLSSMTITYSLLKIYDTTNECIDWLEYNNTWFEANNFKKDGGWSLERIDSENFFSNNLNWKASVHPSGGTPGSKNSISSKNPDRVIPKITSLSVESEKTIRLSFSKELIFDELSNSGNFSMENNRIETVTVEEAKNNEIILNLSTSLKQNKIDTLTILPIHDLSGNLIQKTKLKVTLPLIPENYQDIIINEILFNPIEDGVDYVEIYNNTTDTWNISQIFISNRRNGELQKRISITEKPELLFPEEYLVLTNNPEKICKQYNCPENGKFATVPLPSLPDTEGNIIFLSANGTIFDEFTYKESMHHAFIKDKNGVSLERIHPQLITQNSESWHSAASDAGFGTPAKKNSQFYDLRIPQQSKSNFWIETKSFSPDNDGFNDLLQIKYLMTESGFSGTVSIFTTNGGMVKRLYNNILLSNEGTLFWDGTAENGTICNVGVYIIYIEYQHSSGKKRTEKIVCALTSR